MFFKKIDYSEPNYSIFVVFKTRQRIQDLEKIKVDKINECDSQIKYENVLLDHALSYLKQIGMSDKQIEKKVLSFKTDSVDEDDEDDDDEDW